MKRSVFGSLALGVALVAATSWAHDQVPATQPDRPYAIVGATVHTVTGPVVENGTIVVSGGRITAIGSDIEVDPSARRIDGRGKHVYPGLIDADNTIGLVEIDAVRATVDTAETGAINPNARTQVAINPDSEVIPTTRSNGVLIAHVTPLGGLVSGTSAVVMLDGWTWEQMTLVPSAAVVFDWPAMLVARNWEKPDDEKKQIEARDRQLAHLEKTFDDARAYWQASRAATQPAGRPIDFDARWEAMWPLFDRTLPAWIRADEVSEIEAALAFAARQKIRCVIVGGRDAALCAEQLKRDAVPIVITGTHRLPRTSDDPYDSVYALPAKLKAAGVPFAICTNGWPSSVRNLPYQAASATAFDLSREDALRSITLWPAQILGIAGRVGSLEVGKDATLILTDGDILDIPTHVEAAFIQGRPVDLNDRHKRLNAKYERRVPSTQRTAD